MVQSELKLKAMREYLISYLFYVGRATWKKLREVIPVAPATLSKILKDLEKRGIVKRVVVVEKRALPAYALQEDFKEKLETDELAHIVYKLEKIIYYSKLIEEKTDKEKILEEIASDLVLGYLNALLYSLPSLTFNHIIQNLFDLIAPILIVLTEKPDLKKELDVYLLNYQEELKNKNRKEISTTYSCNQKNKN